MPHDETILVGRLGRDPDVREYEGRPVANFSLAVDRVWKNKTSGEKQKLTVWWDVAAWGPQADVAGKYLKKGHECMLIGRAGARAYIPKDKLEPVAQLTLTVDRLVLLGGNDGGRPTPEPEPWARDAQVSGGEADNDAPATQAQPPEAPEAIVEEY